MPPENGERKSGKETQHVSSRLPPFDLTTGDPPWAFEGRVRPWRGCHCRCGTIDANADSGGAERQILQRRNRPDPPAFRGVSNLRWIEVVFHGASLHLRQGEAEHKPV